MTARENASTSLLRDASVSLLRDARHSAAATARRAARRPSRLAAGLAATAAAGAIAATAATAPWTSAAPTLADDARVTPATASQSATAGHPAVTGQAATTTAGHAATATAGHAATHSAQAATATADAARKAHVAKKAHAAHAAHAARKAAAATTIYDSVSPSAIPAGKAVAAYSNGSYQASPSSVAGRGHVLWIDTSGSSPGADALDVEPGDATPAGAAAWVKAKLTRDHGATAIVYTFKSAWPGVTASISSLPSWMQSHVRYWIADPTGTPHIVPGASATQWYWGPSYDITQAKPGFFS